MDSRLNGRPILVGGTSDRGVVAAWSYEDRKFGVHSAMTMKPAKQLCPEAIVIKGNSHNYLKYSDMVSEIVQGSVPVFEKTSIDDFSQYAPIAAFYGLSALGVKSKNNFSPNKPYLIDFLKIVCDRFACCTEFA